MNYIGSESQNRQLRSAMVALRDDRGVSDTEIVHELMKWKDSLDGHWPEFSAKTYSRYRTGKGGIKPRNGELIFSFLSRGPERYRILSVALSGRQAISDDQKFVDTLLQRFSWKDGGFSYDHIQSMCYTYEFYRRSWRINDGKHFVRSILRIEKEEGLYHISELQRFTFQGTETNQIDRGFILPYSTNFYAITNSDACMKFFDFHDLYPSPVPDKAVETMMGNLIAVAGKGPHPSFRIYARRARNAVEPGHYHVDQFNGQEDMSGIIGYIMNYN